MFFLYDTLFEGFLQEGRGVIRIFRWECALVAQGRFFLMVKWLALRAGQR